MPLDKHPSEDSRPHVWVLGIDEAGYGPNLGPLLIAATLWRSSEAAPPDTWYSRLAGCVTDKAPEAGDTRLFWADSKQVYRAGQGRAALERGVLAAVHLAGLRPKTLCDLWCCLTGEESSAPGGPSELLWPGDFDPPLPLEAGPWSTDRLAPTLEASLRDAGLELVALRARALHPGPFNTACQRLGSKSAVLSQQTLALAGSLLAEYCHAAAQIFCDRHGARQRYQECLQIQFPDDWIEVQRETSRESRYAWGAGPGRREIRFVVGGEQFMPVALASMLAKYLREVSMLAFNEYWCRRVDGLRPTAGYPVDARRFCREIAAAQTACQIPDEALWRER